MNELQSNDACMRALQSFHETVSPHAYEYLGAHKENGRTVFRVWAPHANAVWVCGEFGGWGTGAISMRRMTEGGVWEVEADAAAIGDGMPYQYRIQTGIKEIYQTDPYGYVLQHPYRTASVVCDINGYAWRDGGWMRYRSKRFTRERAVKQAINVYSLHLGSWMRNEERGEPLSYATLARELAPYVKQMGYTHISLLPIAEHFPDAAHGFLTCGYFAPSSCYGSPIDFMQFVDSMHEAGIGVLLEWTPAYFSKTTGGLATYDGEPLYEVPDGEGAVHRFDLTRPEVRSFLLSNAVYWIEKYHVDGLCAHGVQDGFFGELNDYLAAEYPDVMTVARNLEKTDGAQGFTFTQHAARMEFPLSYMQLDPLWRKFEHSKMVASVAGGMPCCEMVGVTHRDVSGGRGSLLSRMHGEYLRKFAGARLFLAYLMTVPGKKLLFMGSEIGSFSEWQADKQVEWFLTDYEQHAAMQRFCADLNHFYLEQPALWERDGRKDSFAWIDADNADHSIFSYRRRAGDGKELIIVLNFTPVAREDYLLAVPAEGVYEEVFNTNLKKYGGEDACTALAAETVFLKTRSSKHAVRIPVPPLSAVIYRRRESKEDAD